MERRTGLGQAAEATDPAVPGARARRVAEAVADDPGRGILTTEISPRPGAGR